MSSTSTSEPAASVDSVKSTAKLAATAMNIAPTIIPTKYAHPCVTDTNP